MNESEQVPIHYPRLRTITRVAIGAGALIVAVLIAVVLVATRPVVEVSNGDHNVRRVVVFEAQKVPVQRQWQGYGTVEAIDVADVPAQVSAMIADLPQGMRPGRSVQRDELLMKLDDADYQHQVEISGQRIAEIESQLAQWEIERTQLQQQMKLDDADAALAQSEFERVRRITDQLAGNQQQLDRAQREWLASQRKQSQTRESLQRMAPRRLAIEAQLEAERATLAMAQLNVQRCAIRSPLDGVLAAMDVNQGEQVQPGMRVARVVNLAKVEAPLQLPGAARNTLSLGDVVILRSSDDRGITWPAQVTRISPVNDADTRTVSVYVEVDQHEQAAHFSSQAGRDLLLPGAFVSGVVTSKQVGNRWIVPRRSVRGQRLQVVQDGKLISRAVTVDFVIEGAQPAFGLPDTQWAVLADEGEPLHEGEQVLLDGAVSLLDGQRVEPTTLKTQEGQP